MQIAQTAQERMKRGLQCSSGVASNRVLFLIATLQVGAGAESLSRASQNEAADLVALVVNDVECFAEASQHVSRDRIHHFLMVKQQCGNGSVEFQFAIVELHAFPRLMKFLHSRCTREYFAAWNEQYCFEARLSGNPNGL
jgi:hypothetical protein